MNVTPQKPTAPRTYDKGPSPSRHRPQIGISVMLLLVIIFAIISAGLVYAARIPEIQEEWSVLTGTTMEIDRSNRIPQILFILFTFSSPLMIATVLWAGMTLVQKISNRSL